MKDSGVLFSHRCIDIYETDKISTPVPLVTASTTPLTTTTTTTTTTKPPTTLGESRFGHIWS